MILYPLQARQEREPGRESQRCGAAPQFFCVQIVWLNSPSVLGSSDELDCSPQLVNGNRLVISCPKAFTKVVHSNASGLFLLSPGRGWAMVWMKFLGWFEWTAWVRITAAFSSISLCNNNVKNSICDSNLGTENYFGVCFIHAYKGKTSVVHPLIWINGIKQCFYGITGAV